MTRPRAPLPADNVYWGNIDGNDRVEDVGHAWVVHRPNGTKAVAYWEGQDAAKAHRFLAKRAKEFKAD